MAGISSKALAFGGAENKYKFNDGTELNTDISVYETTYRGLDPQIGRFWQIDPFADISHEFSPYIYANNDPISLNDPDGLFAEDPDPGDDDRPRVTKESFLGEVVVKGKYPKGLDTKNGQVYESRSKFWDVLEGHRSWKAYPGSLFRYAVDHRGYIMPNAPAPANQLVTNPPVGFNRINIKAVFNLKNWIKRRFAVYRGMKGGKIYFGKAATADGSLKARYTAVEIERLQAEVIAGLDNIPSNVIALGVEQIVIDLNGGVGAANIANKIPATIKEIYMIEARLWLNSNIPNWESVLKYQ